MFIRTLLRAAVPAAIFTGLAIAPLGAQATFTQDDGGPNGHTAMWLSAAGLTSAAVFATFLRGGPSRHAATVPSTPSPFGAAVTTPGPAVSPGSAPPGVTVPTIFVPTLSTPTSNLPLADTGPAAVTTTPEPASLALVATGLFGLAPLVRRRRT